MDEELVSLITSRLPSCNGIYYSSKLDQLIAVNVSVSLTFGSSYIQVLSGENITNVSYDPLVGDLAILSDRDERIFNRRFGLITLIQKGLDNFYEEGLLVNKEDIRKDKIRDYFTFQQEMNGISMTISDTAEEFDLNPDDVVDYVYDLVK